MYLAYAKWFLLLHLNLLSSIEQGETASSPFLQPSKRPREVESLTQSHTAGLQTHVPLGPCPHLSPLNKDRLEIGAATVSGWNFTLVKTPVNQKDSVDKFNRREAEPRPNLLTPSQLSRHPLIAAGSIVVDFPLREMRNAV